MKNNLSSGRENKNKVKDFLNKSEGGDSVKEIVDLDFITCIELDYYKGGSSHVQ